MPVQQKKTKRLKSFKFGTLLVVFKCHRDSEGVKHNAVCEGGLHSTEYCTISQSLTLCPTSDVLGLRDKTNVFRQA